MIEKDCEILKYKSQNKSYNNKHPFYFDNWGVSFFKKSTLFSKSKYIKLS